MGLVATEEHVQRRMSFLRSMVSMRMIRLFIVMRRAGVLAQRRKFDLSEIEWRILTYLGEEAPLSLNSLAEVVVQDRGQLSRTVKAMVARGLLTRQRKPGGPEIEINLSDKAQELYQEMVDWVAERDEILTEGIDPDDIAAVLRVVDTMTERAEAHFEDERARA